MMALSHQILKTRKHLNKWESWMIITDAATGRMWHPLLSTSFNPTLPHFESLIATRKTQIQQELDYEANDLNLTTDEERLLEHYRSIKEDVIVGIRNNPNVTQQQAADAIDAMHLA